MKLHVWAFVAAVMAFGSRGILAAGVEWSVVVRAGLALSPLIPTLLYVRALGRWMRGLDEMQRRIQLETALVATTGGVFVAIGLDLLGAAGVAEGIGLRHGLGWEGMFAVVIVFAIVGNAIVNRRYR